MASQHLVVDITDLPALRDIAEEVRRTGEARILKAAGDDVAIILPLRKQRGRTRRSRTAEDRAAFRASAGGWKGLVDADALKAAIRESRDRSIRPPVDL